MATISSSLRHVRCRNKLLNAQHDGRLLAAFANLALGRRAQHTAALSSQHPQVSETLAMLEEVKMPYTNMGEIRRLPVSPSYFSRETQFNDLYVQLAKLLTKYHQLPTVATSQAASRTWFRVTDMRAQMGERIKAGHYANVLRLAKRLSSIEASIMPEEVSTALLRLTRNSSLLINKPRTLTVDQFGRAVGVGKRKASTARAFVVEGTGEIQVNGKSLSEVFGRVHDRESAVWALTSTKRLDKYNVWALVDGGGTTGQAEALTLAVAKGMVAHEPALKTALRRGMLFPIDARVSYMVCFGCLANLYNL